MGVTFLREILTQRRKLNLSSSSALKVDFRMDEQDLGGLTAGRAAVGAPWCPCPGHRCVRRVPPSGPARLQDTAPLLFTLLGQRGAQSQAPRRVCWMDRAVKARAGHSPPCMALKRGCELCSHEVRWCWVSPA